MTLRDWDLDAQKMTDEELKARVEALETLKAWPVFQEQFKGFGIFVLIPTLGCEIESRERKALTAAPDVPPGVVPMMRMEKRINAPFMVWLNFSSTRRPPDRIYYDDRDSAFKASAIWDNSPVYKAINGKWKRQSI